MSTSASYIACSVLLCVVGITALYHGIASRPLCALSTVTSYVVHHVYCHMFCAFSIAVLQIVYCVLPFVCAVGTAVLCACMLYYRMLCTVGIAASCIGCDVLVPQIYCYIVPAGMATFCQCCACVQHCSM